MKVSLVVVAGLTLIAGGLIAFATNDAGTDVGWFAYTPADDGRLELDNGARLITPADQVCLAVVGGGVAVLTGAGGFLLGRRRSGVAGG